MFSCCGCFGFDLAIGSNFLTASAASGVSGVGLLEEGGELSFIL